MKRWTLMAIFILICALLTGCAPDVTARGEAQTVRMFAANVGKGDAILVCVDDYACLIDTGKIHARGKVLAAMDYMGVERLNAVFITHTDNDHVGGLEWLAESEIPVDAWYASAMFVEVDAEDHPAVEAATARGQSVAWLQRGDRVSLGNTGAVLEVLAPSELNQDKDDNNSLVMMLETGEGRILLTGDMELPQEAVLLAVGDDLSCAVLKVPNHADDDTTSEALARAAHAQVAVISTNSEEKQGTPDPGVVGRLQAVGTRCYVTQDAALGVEVTLSGGSAATRYVDIDAAVAAEIRIREVVPGDDVIVIANEGTATVDLANWYLYSDRGDEMFVFPQGFQLAGGQNVIIGTRTSQGERYDLFWDDKKVIHQSKEDIITLYDGWGRAVSAMSNGY